MVVDAPLCGTQAPSHIINTGGRIAPLHETARGRIQNIGLHRPSSGGDGRSGHAPDSSLANGVRVCSVSDLFPGDLLRRKGTYYRVCCQRPSGKLCPTAAKTERLKRKSLMNGSVEGKRVLITQCEAFMGPACTDIFRQRGAAVVADNSDLRSSDACRAVIEAAGEVDVLVVNLASPNLYGTAVTDVVDDEWHSVFDLLVHPLHWLVRAVIPQMIERQREKLSSSAAQRHCGRWGAFAPTALHVERRFPM